MDALKVSEVKMVVYRHNSKTKVVSESIKRERSSHLFKGQSCENCSESQSPLWSWDFLPLLEQKKTYVMSLSSKLLKNGQEIYHSTSHKRHVIKVGTMIRFLVKSVNEEILHFSGSLIPASTGSIRWLSKNWEEASRNSHKRRESEGRREEISVRTVDGGALSDEYHVSKKPRKRNVREGSERTE